MQHNFNQLSTVPNLKFILAVSTSGVLVLYILQIKYSRKRILAGNLLSPKRREVKTIRTNYTHELKSEIQLSFTIRPTVNVRSPQIHLLC